MSAMPSRPRITVRLRLALLYGGMVLLSGGALIAVFYAIFRASYPGGGVLGNNPYLSAARSHQPGAIVILPSGLRVPYAGVRSIQQALDRNRDAVLADLLWQCLTALAAVAVIAVASGWWIAGRALRPVQDITATARRVAARNLH